MNGMVRELKRSKEFATGKTKTQVREFINLDVLICLLIPYILSPFFVLLFDDWKLLNSCKLRFRWIYRNMSLGNMSLVLSKHEFGCDLVCQLVIIMVSILPDTGWIERACSNLKLIVLSEGIKCPSAQWPICFSYQSLKDQSGTCQTLRKKSRGYILDIRNFFLLVL